jgi:hypothetical protein
MKTIVIAAALSFASFANASLYDHSVYTNAGISAECSDFLGKVASAGPIALRDFLINDGSGAAGCALNSASDVYFIRGQVRSGGSRLGCVSAASVKSQEMVYGSKKRPVDIYGQMGAELQDLSQRLAHGAVPNMKAVTVTLPQQNIILSAEYNQNLVITVMGTNPRFVDTGVFISGGVRPQNIFWHFPEATTLTIARSGSMPLGIPGIIVAPYADVYFNNALVTGAIYSNRLVGAADRADCRGMVSGQINHVQMGPLEAQQQQGKPKGGKYRN